VIGIAEQGEIELLFLLEGGLGFDGIGAEAEDGDVQFIKIFFCVTKLGRFDGSTGGVGFRKEKEKNAMALEIAQGDECVVIRFEAEAGGFGAYFEHRIPSRQVLEAYDPTASAALSQMPATGAKVRNSAPEVLESPDDCPRLKSIRIRAL
jgi:hypothetical protein